MSYVFISYSSKDKSFVKKLAADLRVHGNSVWVDEGEIKIGDSLISKIRKGIDEVDYLVAVLSKSSIDSEWVLKEIELASNREIKEKKVIVLPILLDIVQLPGFLEGKKYCDMSDLTNYNEKLKEILVSIGSDTTSRKRDTKEILDLYKELELLKKEIKSKESFIKKISNYNFEQKSVALKESIISENKSFPEYSTINNTYAFESMGIPVTLGYLLHCIRKADLKGGHIIEFSLTLENKWNYAYRMIEAYSDMIKSIMN